MPGLGKEDRQSHGRPPEQGTVAQTSHPCTLEIEAGIAMNLRPAWAAETLSFWDTRLPYPRAAANHSLVMRRAAGPWLVPRPLCGTSQEASICPASRQQPFPDWALLASWAPKTHMCKDYLGLSSGLLWPSAGDSPKTTHGAKEGHRQSPRAAHGVGVRTG